MRGHEHQQQEGVWPSTVGVAVHVPCPSTGYLTGKSSDLHVYVQAAAAAAAVAAAAAAAADVFPALHHNIRC